jgi:hypothetical protein
MASGIVMNGMRVSGVDHLRRVVAGAAGGDRHGADQPRVPDGPEIHDVIGLVPGELAVVMGVVPAEVLAVELVAAVHGGRAVEVLLGHGPGAFFRVQVAHAVGGDRAGKQELDGLAVRAGLVGSQTQQVERAAHVDLVARLRGELHPRAQQRREVIDLRDLEHGLEALQQWRLADVADEHLAAQRPQLGVEFPQVDSDDVLPPGVMHG